MSTINSLNTSLSGQSGTGNFAGTTSPTFVTPALGTPASGNLVNCTGVSSSTLATTNTSSNTNYYIPGVPASTTSSQTAYVSANLYFNPGSTNSLVLNQASGSFVMQGNGDKVIAITGTGSSPTEAIFSIRPAGTAGSYLNTQNSINLILGVNTGTTTGSVTNHFQINSSGNITATGTMSLVGNIITKVNGTESGASVTANGYSGVITTSSLTTAAGSNYAITFQNTNITTTSTLFASVMGGTNTTENITIKVEASSSVGAIIIYNNDPSAALNGTILIGYLVV